MPFTSLRGKARGLFKDLHVRAPFQRIKSTAIDWVGGAWPLESLAGRGLCPPEPPTFAAAPAADAGRRGTNNTLRLPGSV